jgi:uncharacterized membrane protein YhdT
MDALGAQQSWFHWWLRANGRYLAPKGAFDRRFAAMMYLRNLLAVHLEFGALALLLGAVLGFFDMAIWWVVFQYGQLMGLLPGSTALPPWALICCVACPIYCRRRGCSCCWCFRS